MTNPLKNFRRSLTDIINSRTDYVDLFISIIILLAFFGGGIFEYNAYSQEKTYKFFITVFNLVIGLGGIMRVFYCPKPSILLSILIKSGATFCILNEVFEQIWIFSCSDQIINISSIITLFLLAIINIISTLIQRN